MSPAGAPAATSGDGLAVRWRGSGDIGSLSLYRLPTRWTVTVTAPSTGDDRRDDATAPKASSRPRYAGAMPFIDRVLIVLSGLPGTGKSTVADGIARALRLPVLSVDPLESAILRAGIAPSFKTGWRPTSSRSRWPTVTWRLASTP
jgi:hypothetical protein